MTSTDLVVQSTAYSRASLTERQQYVTAIASAGSLLPAHLRQGQTGDRGKAFLMAETGDMLGIHPMAAFTGVHIIEGRPSISANLMGGLVRKAGHKLRVRMTGSLADKSLTATATLIRSDDPDFEFEVVWTIAKAERAGLFPGKANSNWQKYPEAMLKARAISEIIREGAPDVLMGGNVYTPEELGTEVDEQGEPVELTEVRPESGQVDGARQEAAIVDETPPAAEGERDWIAEVANAGSAQELRGIYNDAKRAGALQVQVEYLGDTVALGAMIVDIGKALDAAEKEQADETPAVLAEDEPVDAEIVDE